MNKKRKVGRPKKVDYTPTIHLTYSDNLVWDIIKIKRQLGMPLTIGELRDLVNHDLKPYGFKVTITVTPKQSFYKRLINQIKNIFKNKK